MILLLVQKIREIKITNKLAIEGNILPQDDGLL